LIENANEYSVKVKCLLKIMKENEWERGIIFFEKKYLVELNLLKDYISLCVAIC